jgi:hypothetical protein
MKAMPNKSTYMTGSAGSDKPARIQKNQTGGDLRSKPCMNAGKGKQG